LERNIRFTSRASINLRGKRYHNETEKANKDA